MKLSKILKLLIKIKKVSLLQVYASGLLASFKVIRDGNPHEHRMVESNKYPSLKASYVGFYKEAMNQLELKKRHVLKLITESYYTLAILKII